MTRQTSVPAGRPPRGFQELAVWRCTMDLVVESYRVSTQFPVAERYGLTAQLRRAAISIPSNIAEGNGRLHRKEYIHLVSIARGSLRELETLVEIACRLGYMTPADVDVMGTLANHCGRMLTRMIRSLSRLGPGTAS